MPLTLWQGRVILGQHGAVRLIIQGAELGHAHQVHVLAGDEALDGLHTPPEHWCHSSAVKRSIGSTTGFTITEKAPTSFHI